MVRCLGVEVTEGGGGILSFTVLSTLPLNPGDSRFWIVSPGLQNRI